MPTNKVSKFKTELRRTSTEVNFIKKPTKIFKKIIKSNYFSYLPFKKQNTDDFEESKRKSIKIMDNSFNDEKEKINVAQLLRMDIVKRPAK